MTAREFWTAFIRKLGFKGWKIEFIKSTYRCIVTENHMACMKFIGPDDTYKMIYSSMDVNDHHFPELCIYGDKDTMSEDDVIDKIFTRLKILLTTYWSFGLIADKMQKTTDAGKQIMLKSSKVKYNSLEEFLINIDLNYGMS